MQSVNDTIFKAHVPTYNDGCFYLYILDQTNDVYAREFLTFVGGPVYFEELSVSDKLKFEAEERDILLTGKIRISQNKNITSFNVIKIGKEYFSVYNIFHFTNEYGYKQSDITLSKYKGDL